MISLPPDGILYHGSYPIRIQGTDIASGVKGNIIYSSVMVVAVGTNTPIVAIRYNDKNNGLWYRQGWANGFYKAWSDYKNSWFRRWNMLSV